MTVTQITDHAAQALARQSSWTNAMPRLRELVEYLGDQVQLLEDVIFDVLENSILDNAGCAGEILDEYGVIFNHLRGSLTDAQYKRVLKVVIAAYQSDGTAKKIAELASTLIGVAVKYQQYIPAHYRLEYEISTAISGDWETRVLQILEILRPAGVSYSLVEGSASGAFRFDTGPGFDAGRLGRRVI